MKNSCKIGYRQAHGNPVYFALVPVCRPRACPFPVFSTFDSVPFFSGKYQRFYCSEVNRVLFGSLTQRPLSLCCSRSHAL